MYECLMTKKMGDIYIHLFWCCQSVRQLVVLNKKEEIFIYEKTFFDDRRLCDIILSKKKTGINEKKTKVLFLGYIHILRWQQWLYLFETIVAVWIFYRANCWFGICTQQQNICTMNIRGDSSMYECLMTKKMGDMLYYAETFLYTSFFGAVNQYVN